MKIAVVADTHRETDEVDRWLRAHPQDLLLHLGDHASDGRWLSENLQLPAICVRGNNDWQTDEEDEPFHFVLPVHGHRLLLTHGHRERVHSGVHALYWMAKENGCDFALFGHTHVRSDRDFGDVRILNPGSASFPRDGHKSILLLEFVKWKDPIVQFVDLDEEEPS